MQPAFHELFDAALKLPEDERLILASRLLETVPDQPSGLSLDDPGLVEELTRRSADREGTIPWSQVRDEL